MPKRTCRVIRIIFCILIFLRLRMQLDAVEAIMFSLCPVSTWTRLQGGRVHYTHPAAILSSLVFLSRSTMLQRDLAIGTGSVSVCLSVFCKRVLSVRLSLVLTVKSSSFHRRTEEVSLKFFWYQLQYHRSERNALARASNETGVSKRAKKLRFSTVNRYISETIEAKHNYSYNGRLIGSRVRAFDWCQY